MIQLIGVSKTYRTKKALEDINCHFPSGEIVGIVGQNGSGKSTLLKLLAGLIRPTQGAVFINGKKADRRVARQVAYLSELDTYYSFYTVKEMIAYYETLFPDFCTSTATKITVFMKLDPDQKIGDLSKGNRGKFKILLALSRKAPFILMDEPLSGLDQGARRLIIEGILSFIDTETQTLLITSHHIREIETLLSMIVVIHEGKIEKIAQTDDLRLSQGVSIDDWTQQFYN